MCSICLYCCVDDFLRVTLICLKRLPLFGGVCRLGDFCVYVFGNFPQENKIISEVI